MTEAANEFEGFEFTRSINPSKVTRGLGILAATDAIREAARNGIEKAAKDVIEPVAKQKAPLLMPESMKKAGRVGGDQGGVPGELRASARVDMIDPNTAAISFNTVYASLQHERMEWHHVEGEAKYLENAMNETREEQVRVIADEIRAVTGG